MFRRMYWTGITLLGSWLQRRYAHYHVLRIRGS